MFGKSCKTCRILSYLAAALLLCGASLFFYELLLSAERKSFFAFQSDFIAGFLPWNTHHNLYPGEAHGLRDLLAAFMAQFYRNWGAVAFTVMAGLLFCALFTFICRKSCRFFRKPLPLLFLPLFWAVVFLSVQLSLALRQNPDYLGLKHHRADSLVRKNERLLTEGRYNEVLETANKYWFSHPCPVNDVVTGKNTLYNDLTETEIRFRQTLAPQTYIALLGAHRLNEDFFAYYRVPEIYNHPENAGGSTSYRCAVLLEQITGNHTVAYSQAMNAMEVEGLSYSMLQSSVFSALVCFQYNLAEKYIRLLKGSLFYRRQAEVYQTALHALQNESDGASMPKVARYMEKIRTERGKAPKSYIHGASESERARELWRQSPYSLENLERIALMDLLYKNTGDFVSRIPDYVRLSAQKTPYRLPKTWQEMLHILMRENPGSLDCIAPYMENMVWNDEIKRQCERFYEAKERLRRQLISPQQITQSFGHTFIYNYYFSRFVSANEIETNQILAH